MKKFMRIALVFALAGATLMYTGCTKDYSGDISDLNNQLGKQEAAITTLQAQVNAAQTTANEALEAAKKADDKAAIAELEARIKKLEEAQAKIDAVVEQIKKDTKADVEKALKEIKAEVEAAIAKVEGNFSVAAGESRVWSSYAYAKWAPLADKQHVGWYNKLAKVFPELAEIKKGDMIEAFGELPFIVNPSTVELDDTYSFELVDKDGYPAGVALGNPTPGYRTKGTSTWTVDVMSPAHDLFTGKAVKEANDLSLVVTNKDGVSAQTAFAFNVFDYTVDQGQDFAFSERKEYNVGQYQGDAFIGNTVDLAWFDVLMADPNGAPLYEDYFIIEALDAARVEEYGISIDGSKLTIDKGPEAGKLPIAIKLKITGIGVNGVTAEKEFTVNVSASAIAPNAELADQAITLGYKNGSYNVPVVYNFADFGFTALEKEAVFNALKANNTVVLKNEDNEIVLNNGLFFLKSNGTTPAETYSEAASFGFAVDSRYIIPGEYEVGITDGSVFYGTGVLTIANPEAHAIKLIPAFCDENGVLQVVGTPGEKFITYELANAFVTAISGVEVPSPLAFTDVDAEYPEDSWVSEGTTLKVYKNSDVHHDLYTVRNFSVKYPLFGNTYNLVSLDFQAEVISPIYDAEGKSIAVTDPTIYVNADKEAKKFSSVEVKDFVGKGTFVAGFEYKGLPFNIYNVWTTTPEGGSDPVYKYWAELQAGVFVTPYNIGTRNTTKDYAPYYTAGEYEDDWFVNTKDGERIQIEDSDITIANLKVLGLPAAGADKFFYDSKRPTLYLMGMMFQALQAVDAKYYDVNGKELSAYTKKDADGKNQKIFYNLFKEGHGYTGSFNEFKTMVESVTLAEAIANTGHTKADFERWGKIAETDQAAVTLFQKYQNKFGEIITPAVKPTDVPTVKEGRHEFVAAVKVALSETANTFIGEPVLADPYATVNTSKFSLKEDAGAHLSGDSVVIPGQIAVLDAWGMVTVKAFNLTIKTK